MGDRTVGRIVNGFTGWFYRSMAEVAVPSEATGGKIVDQGVRADHVTVVRRGVDTEAFHPRHRDDGFWRARGLSGKNTLLYAGRVSPEKNLRFLSLLLRYLVDARGVETELAIVGDEGIHRRVGDDYWARVRDLMLDGLRAGAARDAIVAGVAEVGRVLGEHFPRRPDDTNELTDRVSLG
jgi:glycosyltransferase involved in cell wall biosynthesis